MADEFQAIGPDEIAYRLELTPAELKVTYYALHSFLDDLGHDQADVLRVLHRVLGKLPEERSVRDIDVTSGS